MKRIIFLLIFCAMAFALSAQRYQNLSTLQRAPGQNYTILTDTGGVQKYALFDTITVLDAAFVSGDSVFLVIQGDTVFSGVAGGGDGNGIISALPLGAVNISLQNKPNNNFYISYKENTGFSGSDSLGLKMNPNDFENVGFYTQGASNFGVTTRSFIGAKWAAPSNNTASYPVMSAINTGSSIGAIVNVSPTGSTFKFLDATGVSNYLINGGVSGLGSGPEFSLSSTRAIIRTNNDSGSSSKVLSADGTGALWVNVTSLPVTNPIGGANTLQAALDSLAIAGGADGNGIYGGNGVVPPSTVASLAGDFSITDGNAGFSVNTGYAMAEIFGGNSFIQAGDSATINSAGSDGSAGQILIATAGDGAAWGNAGTLPVTNPAGGANALQAALDSLFAAGNLTFSNGLTKTGSAVKLGGTLTENTTITGGAFGLTVTTTGASIPGLTTQSPYTGLQASSTNGSSSILGSTSNSSTNTILNNLSLIRNTTGTAANGIGQSISLAHETSTGISWTANEIKSLWSVATNASRTSRFVITGVNNGDTTPDDHLTIEGTGQLQLNKYGAGTFTGTAATMLAATASGAVVETAIPAAPPNVGGISAMQTGAPYSYNADVSGQPVNALSLPTTVGVKAGITKVVNSGGHGIEVNFGGPVTCQITGFVTFSGVDDFYLQVYVNGAPLYSSVYVAATGSSQPKSCTISHLADLNNGDIVTIRLHSTDSNTCSIISAGLTVVKTQ